MLEKIIRLGKETAIYGLSTVVGRLLNFLLVPFYTNFLLPAEYGVIANIYAYIAFAFVVFGYGMDQAYMRFVSSLEMGDKKQNFSTPFFSVLASSIALSVVVHSCSPLLAGWIGLEKSQEVLIRYAAWILCFDAMANVPFAALRMEQRAKRFAALKLANIVLTLILNIVLIAGLHMKADGVLIANVIASAATFFLALVAVRDQLTAGFSFPLYKQMLRFGLPYIPAGLAGIAIQVVDRPIVRALTSDATLGIYQANYRLGIFMMLIVGMFDYAWRPFFLNHAKDEDAKQLFAKALTYLLIAMMGVFLGVSLFIDDIVRIHVFGKYFIHPNYWSGLDIVPWILLAYVFTGVYVVFVVGVYLEKKTIFLPLVTGAGAVVNVALNFLLIPRFGIMGAAQATLWAYVVMAVGIYLVSRRYYQVPYEWSKIVRIASAVAVVWLAFGSAHMIPGSLSGIFVKLGLLLTFPVLLVLLRVFERRELEAVKRIFAASTGSP